MEWISVKERLPETGEYASDDVLWCTFKNGELMYRGIANVGKDGQWYKAGISLRFYPTHWMPLPEPPNDTTL